MSKNRKIGIIIGVISLVAVLTATITTLLVMKEKKKKKEDQELMDYLDNSIQ